MSLNQPVSLKPRDTLHRQTELLEAAAAAAAAAAGLLLHGAGGAFNSGGTDRESGHWQLSCLILMFRKSILHS